MARVIGAVLGALLALGMPAFAQSPQDLVVRQLQQQGYERITISRTLLGRSRIRASGPDGRREIIVDPRTGAILRDTIYLLDQDSRNGSGQGSLLGGGQGAGGGNGGESGGFEDGDDDEDDEEDDEDEHDDDEDDDDDDDDRGDDRDDDDDDDGGDDNGGGDDDDDDD